ncbi:hypothetical protein AVU38_gp211 [Ralstonia phage RSL2]|uniref:Uncharacterized protein n=1 Tax=Ralstonia phage RSL2 TaxID=1585840 RepID=A0A0A8J9R0_9CAUD|nr:hypothetical protein AVU38_gp211 [Ralstonia phage RSL2]BAQ02739.1 hypothetical protein [Ralstonia phage RSL2]
MRDKIIDYYKILLDLGWMVADEEGNVSVKLGDQLMPATINGSRVVLPTREQMKNQNWKTRIGFHPLREAFNLGISDLVATLRDQFVQRLNASIAYLMKELIAIAYDQDNQKNLSTEQSQVLNALSKCDASLVKDFESIQKSTKSRNNADMFINIFIKRGGVVKGVTYGRAGIVTFPIYESLKKPEKEPINGVKLTNKNREMLIKLYEFVFPTLLADPEFFNVGINSRSAPFIESLVRAVLNVVDALVETAQPYMGIVDLPEILTFPEDLGTWKEIFDSKDMVEKLARTIPALNSNEAGEEMDREKEAETRREPRREERDMGRAEEVRERGHLGATTSSAASAPRGRMVLGAPAPASTGETLGKALPDRTREASGTDRAVTSEREARSAADRERREIERRERELREREERLERDRREEEDRELRERRRERDYDDRRARDRDYDRDDRRRDRERDRRDDRDYDDRDRRRERTGDIFEDNPALRDALRDEERRDDRYGRRRDYDDRDYDRNDRRRGIRDIRDRARRDRDYDDRDDRYDRRDRYYRR